MKQLLTGEQMLQIVEGASDQAILEAQRHVPRPEAQAEADWLAYGVKEGFYRTATVEWNGKPVATVFHSMEGRTLRINACHSLDNLENLEDVLEVAFRRLAGDRNAIAVRFETRRGGAIRKAVKHGYEICGVILRRVITGVPQGDVRDQAEQQQQSGSGSGEKTDTTESATNQQNAAESGGVALGAGASGNTVSVTTDDVNAINETQAVSTAALASNTDTATAALASNMEALQTASTLAQTGLAASAQTSGEAIASNTEVAGTAIASNLEATHAALDSEQTIAGESIAGGEQESLAALSTAQNLGALGITSGQQTASLVAATSTDDLDAALAANGQAITATQGTENSVVQSALATVLAGQANSNSLVQSVVNSNTAALENSDNLAYQTAAGAVSQEGQIAGTSAGDSNVTPFGVTGSAPSSTHLVLIAAGVLLAVGLVVLVARKA